MERNQIVSAAVKRSAIKVFDAEKIIPDADFEALTEVARYAPSSFGLEPWRLLVIRDKALRDKIAVYAPGAQRQLASASHFVAFVVTGDLDAKSAYFKHISYDVKGLSDEAYEAFVASFGAFQAEKQDLTDARKRIDWAGKQAYIALGNMILAAALLDIDSCPVEGFTPAAVEAVLADADVLNPVAERVVVMAAFGYRQGDPTHKKTRRPLEDVVRFV